VTVILSVLLCSDGANYFVGPMGQGFEQPLRRSRRRRTDHRVICWPSFIVVSNCRFYQIPSLISFFFFSPSGTSHSQCVIFGLCRSLLASILLYICSVRFACPCVPFKKNSTLQLAANLFYSILSTIYKIVISKLF